MEIKYSEQGKLHTLPEGARNLIQEISDHFEIDPSVYAGWGVIVVARSNERGTPPIKYQIPIALQTVDPQNIEWLQALGDTVIMDTWYTGTLPAAITYDQPRTLIRLHSRPIDFDAVRIGQRITAYEFNSENEKRVPEIDYTTTFYPGRIHQRCNGFSIMKCPVTGPHPCSLGHNYPRYYGTLIPGIAATGLEVQSLDPRFISPLIINDLGYRESTADAVSKYGYMVTSYFMGLVSDRESITKLICNIPESLTSPETATASPRREGAIGSIDIELGPQGQILPVMHEDQIQRIPLYYEEESSIPPLSIELGIPLLRDARQIDQLSPDTDIVHLVTRIVFTEQVFKQLLDINAFPQLQIIQFPPTFSRNIGPTIEQLLEERPDIVLHVSRIRDSEYLVKNTTPSPPSQRFEAGIPTLRDIQEIGLLPHDLIIVHLSSLHAITHTTFLRLLTKFPNLQVIQASPYLEKHISAVARKMLAERPKIKLIFCKLKDSEYRDMGPLANI